MKNINHWVVWGVMVSIATISSFAQGGSRKFFIRESDFVFSPDEARCW